MNCPKCGSPAYIEGNVACWDCRSKMLSPPAPCSPAFPEHEKLKTVAHLSQAQGEFLEWLLSERGFVLGKYSVSGEMILPTHYSVPLLLADFHGISQRRLDKEKEVMLTEMRQSN